MTLVESRLKRMGCRGRTAYSVHCDCRHTVQNGGIIQDFREGPAMPVRAYTELLTLHLSSAEIADVLELVQNCMECSDKPELDGVLDRLALLLPFDYHACLFSQNNPDETCDSFSYNIVTTNYDEEWVRTYLDNNYSLIDPIMAACRNSPGLYYWEDVYRVWPPDPEFRSASRAFGLSDGYSASMQNLSGSRCGLISLSGAELSKTERHSLLMDIIAPHIYQAMDRIVYRQKFMETRSITQREKEVLKWVACGKTNWETSVILGISECTIRFHMNNVMRKLNATSKTHAVAIALSTGLVDLG